MIAMMKEPGYRVVAEGIEDEATFALCQLRAIACCRRRITSSIRPGLVARPASIRLSLFAPTEQS